MFRRSSASLFTVLLLSSCGMIPTQYMPNGYLYNDNTPLSSPAPSRPWLDEADHPDLDRIGDNTAAWQGAVYELLSPLVPIIPPATTPVSLATTPPAATGDAAFDHYLRQALLSYGYRVEPRPNVTGNTLVYNVSPLSNPATLKSAQKKFGAAFVREGGTKNMYYLTLELRGANGKTVNTQSTVAVLPYEKTEYARMPGMSVTPTQGKAWPKRDDYNR